MSRQRIAAPHLAASRSGRQQQRTEDAAIAASERPLPAEALACHGSVFKGCAPGGGGAKIAFDLPIRLDYFIHTYPKPLVTLGHGIVMGGGLGILGASKFRVLTEGSRLVLPEITIGLFLDAGWIWTLRNMLPHHAVVLGLTGSHVNATDGLFTKMGTHVTAHDDRAAWLQGFLQLPSAARACAEPLRTALAPASAGRPGRIGDSAQ